MGLFSSSKSSSATVNTNTATTASDNSTALAAGASLTVTDGGATQAAIAAAENMVAGQTDAMLELFSKATTATREAANQQAELAQMVSTSATQLASNAKTPDATIVQTLGKTALWGGALLVVALYVASKR